jgi:hypothetical protein
MSRFGSYEVGDLVLFQNREVRIINKMKGAKTNRPNKQSGIVTGYQSNPCLYTLSNNLSVRGN